MPARVRGNVLVNISDTVTVIGNVISVTGLGSLASVVVAPISAPSFTFTIQANDASAVESDNGARALSIAGRAYGNAGDQVSVGGQVTTISGSGASAVLTITLKSSGASVQVP